MANRRLAPPDQQPKEFSFTAENKAWADKVIARYPQGRQQSAVIPLLWRAQEQHHGWLPQAAIEHVAAMLDMAKIRVLEVATFYTMFLLQPVGRKAHVQWCGTTPCLLRGGEEIKKVCEQRINHEPFHVSADGDFSWEEVECLGACVNAPMVLIGKDTYEDLTPETFEKVLDALGRGEIGADIGERLGLRGGQAERQRGEDPGANTALADAGAPRQHAHARPHEQQGELIGEEFVEGEAQTSRPLRRNIRGPLRIVHRAERFGKSRRSHWDHALQGAGSVVQSSAHRQGSRSVP